MGRTWPRFDTALCRLVGIDIPIVQAPIGPATCPELAAAVSNAGALGTLSVTWRDLDETRLVIRKTKALTDRPFAVNVVLEWPQHDRLQACLEEGVRIVSLFWGDPQPYVAAAHSADAIVMHTVGNAEEARRAVDAGVDVIVAQGWEAGGHVWGGVATLPLVPLVVDAVAPMPVLAAGGIADGRGLAAALALGASGVWMGTRFICADEARVHEVYREKVLEAAETDTVYSTVFDILWHDAPHRALRNSTTEMWEHAGRPPVGERPGDEDLLTVLPDGLPIYRYSTAMPTPEMDGEIESLALYAGQSVGMVHKVQPAADIVAEIAAEAEEALDRLGHALGNTPRR